MIRGSLDGWGGVFSLVLTLLCGQSIVAQPIVRAGIHHESFRFSASESLSSVSLVTIPVSAHVPVGSSVTLGVSSFWARGTVTQQGTESVIQGPTDTEVSATVRIGGGAATVTGVALLPSGHSTHTPEEAIAASVMASDLLLFRVSNWGSGGGGGLRIATARRFGDLGAGVSLGYFMAQDFHPTDDQAFRYRPGNNFVVRGALDRTVGSAGKASLQVTFRQYADDALDGVNLFRSGDRWQAIGSYAFASSRTSSAMIYAGALHQTEGTYLTDLDATGSQTFVVAGVGARLRAGSVLAIPSADFRALRAEDGRDQGYDARVGASFEIPTSHTVLVPVARLHLGKVAPIPNDESSFFGLELGLSARFGGNTR